MAAPARAALLALVSTVLAEANVAAVEPDLELGEHLSSECTACHRADAVNEGIPNIFGRPGVVIVQALEQYRDGSRINAAMRSVARSLSEEDVASLAAYLEQASPH